MSPKMSPCITRIVLLVAVPGAFGLGLLVRRHRQHVRRVGSVRHLLDAGGQVIDDGHTLGSLNTVFRSHAASVHAFEHFDHFDIGATVQGSPQGAHAGSTGRKEVGPAGPHHAHCRGAAILLVVGMQDPEDIQRLHQVLVNLLVNAIQAMPEHNAKLQI